MGQSLDQRLLFRTAMMDTDNSDEICFHNGEVFLLSQNDSSDGTKVIARDVPKLFRPKRSVRDMLLAAADAAKSKTQSAPATQQETTDFVTKLYQNGTPSSSFHQLEVQQRIPVKGLRPITKETFKSSTPASPPPSKAQQQQDSPITSLEFCRDYHYRGFCAFGPHCRYSHSKIDITPIMFSPDSSGDTDWEKVFFNNLMDNYWTSLTPGTTYQSYFFLRPDMIPHSKRRLPVFVNLCSSSTNGSSNTE